MTPAPVPQPVAVTVAECGHVADADAVTACARCGASMCAACWRDGGGTCEACYDEAATVPLESEESNE